MEHMESSLDPKEPVSLGQTARQLLASKQGQDDLVNARMLIDSLSTSFPEGTSDEVKAQFLKVISFLSIALQKMDVINLGRTLDKMFGAYTIAAAYMAGEIELPPESVEEKESRELVAEIEKMILKKRRREDSAAESSSAETPPPNIGMFL